MVDTRYDCDITTVHVSGAHHNKHGSFARASTELDAHTDNVCKRIEPAADSVDVHVCGSQAEEECLGRLNHLVQSDRGILRNIRQLGWHARLLLGGQLQLLFDGICFRCVEEHLAQQLSGALP